MRTNVDVRIFNLHFKNNSGDDCREFYPKQMYPTAYEFYSNGFLVIYGTMCYTTIVTVVSCDRIAHEFSSGLEISSEKLETKHTK
jgi:hypothetical protein